MTLKEYLEKPHKERHYWDIIYKCPHSLEVGDWRKWDKYLKKNYRFQYFVREVVWFELGYLWHRIKDFWCYLKCLCWYRYHVLKLSNNPKYHDSDWCLEKAIEVILVNFVQKERPFEVIDWNCDEDHQEAVRVIKNAYDWFTVVRPLKENEVEQLMNQLYGGKEWWEHRQKENPEYKVKYNRLRNLEDEIEKTNTKVFIDIITYRRYLWT